MLHKLLAKDSELCMLHPIISTLYVAFYVISYQICLYISKDCGGGGWLGEDPTG